MSGRRESSHVGRQGEAIAIDLLKEKGFKILFRNYQSALGEIDIIAISPLTTIPRTTWRGRVLYGWDYLCKWARFRRSERKLVFVEVKTWSQPGPPRDQQGPADAVDERKQEKLTHLALDFLKKNRMLDVPARFDVVEVILAPLSVRHFENAFEAVGSFQWFA